MGSCPSKLAARQRYTTPCSFLRILLSQQIRYGPSQSPAKTLNYSSQQCLLPSKWATPSRVELPSATFLTPPRAARSPRAVFLSTTMPAKVILPFSPSSLSCWPVSFPQIPLRTTWQTISEYTDTFPLQSGPIRRSLSSLYRAPSLRAAPHSICPASSRTWPALRARVLMLWPASLTTMPS